MNFNKVSSDSAFLININCICQIIDIWQTNSVLVFGFGAPHEFQSHPYGHPNKMFLGAPLATA